QNGVLDDGKMTFTNAPATTWLMGTQLIGRHYTGEILDRGARVQTTGHKLGTGCFIQVAVTTDTVRLDAVVAIILALNNQGIVNGPNISFVDINGIVANIQAHKVIDINSTAKEFYAVIIGGVSLQVVDFGTGAHGVKRNAVKVIARRHFSAS